MRELFKRSLLGGFYIGLAMLASLTVAPIPEFGKLLSAAVFPVGILLVIHCNGALFTGVAGQFAARQIISRRKNTLTLHQAPLRQWGKDLAVSLLGNLLGIAILVFLAGRQLGSIEAKAALPALQLFGLGMLCNALVFLALRAKQLPLQYIPVFVFVLLGFEHSIADFALIGLSGQFSWFILPVILGNLVGGALFGLFYQLVKPPKA